MNEGLFRTGTRSENRHLISCWKAQYERCSCVNDAFVLGQTQTDQMSAGNQHQSSIRPV